MMTVAGDISFGQHALLIMCLNFMSFFFRKKNNIASKTLSNALQFHNQMLHASTLAQKCIH